MDIVDTLTGHCLETLPAPLTTCGEFADAEMLRPVDGAEDPRVAYAMDDYEASGRREAFRCTGCRGPASPASGTDRPGAGDGRPRGRTCRRSGRLPPPAGGRRG